MPDSTMAIGTASHTPTVVLIAPNVSERMGGEAIKALQVWRELDALGVDVHQVTHARVRDEIRQKCPRMRATFIEDTAFDRWAWRIRPLRPLVHLGFQWRAAKAAEGLCRQRPVCLVHYTSPISPVLPFFRIRGVPVVVGPLNGNIHHPRPFRRREQPSERLRRVLHAPLQLIHRLVGRGKQAADALLVAGGERTYRSLRLAGCRDEQFVDSLDSGIADHLAAAPRIAHVGRNPRFVHSGRLVPYKGTDLVLRAAAKTRLPVEIDVIGRGPQRAALEQLTQNLGLAGRVRFRDWIAHDTLPEVMRQYRAFVFPSLAEANGIVVQEAMMMGLPTICVNWGGPGLLITPETGVLIEPTSEEHVVNELAAAMDRLAEDGDLADRMSQRGREAAMQQGFLWRDLIRQWIAVYEKVLTKRHGRPIRVLPEAQETVGARSVSE